MAGLHHAIRTGDLGAFFAGGGSRRHAAPARSWGFAAGGLVGDVAAIPNSADAGALNIAIINTRNQQRQFHQKEGARIVVDALEQRNNQVFS
jgi:hypothetical protein